MNASVIATSWLVAAVFMLPAIARTQPVTAAGDTLPFARNQLPETFPSVGAAIGVGFYVTKFPSVAAAFHAIEDAYRAQGYSVSAARDVDLGPMLFATLTVRTNRWMDVALQLGRSGLEGSEVRNHDDLWFAGLLVTGRYQPTAAGSVSLFGGAGGGIYEFSFGRRYGAQLNDYFVLEDVALEGGGAYATAAGGLTFRPGPRTSLELQVQYVGTGNVATEQTSAGRIHVNASGAMIGASFTSFF